MGDEDEWVESTDPTSGRTFFYNPALKQTAWVKPTGSDEEKAAWQRRVDPNTHDVFYYNSITKVRSAVKPKEMKDNVTDDELDITPYENTSTRRHVSIKLGQLQQMVKQQAPKDDQFDKLRAMRRAQDPAQDGNIIDLDALARRNKELNQNKMITARRTFEEFATANFNIKKKGMFGSRVTLADLMNYSERPLKRSLLGLNSSALEKRAAQVSKFIYAFTDGEIKDREHAYKLTYKVIDNAMSNAPQELRDEVFCQLIRHTRLNPNDDSRFRAWQLLTVCCGNFPPSAQLMSPLKLFLDENFDNLEKGSASIASREVNLLDLQENRISISELAQYARLRLDRCGKVGARGKAPSQMEVEKVMQRKPVTVSVFLVNGLEIKMQVDTWTTIKDLIDEIGKYLEIKDITIFSLVEVSEDLKEYVLPIEDRVLDILSDWEIEYRSNRKTDETPENQFLFRIRLFFPVDDGDSRAIELAYYQAVYDVTDGRYPVTVEDISRLVAYQLQEKFGDRTNLSADPIGTNEALCTYLPLSMHTNLGKIREYVNEHYNSFEGYAEIDAMKEYLDLVQEWPTYGCQIFTVSPLNNADFPKECCIAVNAKAVYVIDPASQKFLTTFPWDTIVTWGYTDVNSSALSKRGKKKVENTFCLVMGDFMQQMKLFFKTPQAIDAYRLIEAYGNRLKGYKKK